MTILRRAQMIGLGLAFLLASVVLFVGCKKSGPSSTKTTSVNIASLKERVDFLQQYVTFRRTYNVLDFNIDYFNGDEGMMPSPSQLDIRLVAVVPESELTAWIPAGTSESSSTETDWLKSIPTSLDLSDIKEWYIDGRRIVGLDRTRRIVAYRIYAH